MLPTSDSRHLAKPWSDFYSCEDELNGGACTDGNAQVEEGCQCTCGHCIPDPFIKPEIPLAAEEMEDWGDEYDGNERNENVADYPQGFEGRRRLNRMSKRPNARTMSKREARTTNGRVARGKRPRKPSRALHARVQERRRR